MRSRVAGLIVALVTVVLAACGGAGDPESSGDLPPPAEPATIVVRDGDVPLEITVEIADSASERRRGLSGRDELAENHGMLFVNEEDVTVGYQMKDTLIPLSLAFIAADGVVLGVVDMQPCSTESCPIYEPPRPYRFGLEVNQGGFERWGVESGARLDLPVGR